MIVDIPTIGVTCTNCLSKGLCFDLAPGKRTP